MSKKSGEGPMEYGMLGVDESTTGDKLEKWTGEVTWKYLRPHYESGILLWVDPNLELSKVGEALVNDDAAQVQEWLTKGDVVKPSDLHATQWEAGLEKEPPEEFLVTVVSPFVLMQSPK